MTTVTLEGIKEHNLCLFAVPFLTHMFLLIKYLEKTESSIEFFWPSIIRCLSISPFTNFSQVRLNIQTHWGNFKSTFRKAFYGKGIQSCSNDGSHTFPRGDKNQIAKIHWRHLHFICHRRSLRWDAWWSTTSSFFHVTLYILIHFRPGTQESNTKLNNPFYINIKFDKLLNEIDNVLHLSKNKKIKSYCFKLRCFHILNTVYKLFDNPSYIDET